MSEGTTYGVASVLSNPTIANALAHAIIRPLTRRDSVSIFVYVMTA
ncbi:MAG TPA: hypothetical protein VHJ59_01895 [Nitrososphaera sp.]|jgi:hypothetical protein|nr:hypothetical protein [Nitrososphaera sp.]